MAGNIDEIIESLPASRRRKIEKRAAVLIAEEMTLQELRRARAMTHMTHDDTVRLPPTGRLQPHCGEIPNKGRIAITSSAATKKNSFRPPPDGDTSA